MLKHVSPLLFTLLPIKLSNTTLSLLLIVTGIAIASVFLVPILAQAQEGLIPCALKFVGSSDPRYQLCTICDLFKLFQNIINFIFTYVLIPAGALFLGIGGFMMIFPGAVGQASASSYAKGKKIVTNVAIGIIIALLAWLIVDTLMKALGAGGYGLSSLQFGPWYEIQCTAIPPPIPPIAKATHKVCVDLTCGTADGPGPSSCPEACDGLKLICNTANICQVIGVEGPNEGGCTVPGSACGAACSPATLAAKYGTSPVNKNDPELDAFLACFTTKISVIVVLGEISTYDKGIPPNSLLCNQTRGDTSNPCTPICAHSKNSCHYGGSAGSEGALAVDFGNEKAGDQIREAALKCPQTKVARCEGKDADKKTIIVPCSDSRATHVHISTKKCSGS